MKITAILLASLACAEASRLEICTECDPDTDAQISSEKHEDTLAQISQDVIEYKFSNDRCNEAKLERANLCDASCMGEDDDTVGCGWSWPIGDSAKWNSDEAACRCNQRPLKYAKKEQPA